MNRMKWISLLLTAACVIALCGYRYLNGTRADIDPPQITAQGQLALSVLAPRDTLLEGVTAMDDRDGDVSASLLVEDIRMTERDKIALVTYAAFDRAGNVAGHQREVTFTDYEKPKFTLEGPMIYTVGTDFDPMDVLGAVDVLDGDISGRIRTRSLSGDSLAEVGTHLVSFQVTNSLGDSAEIELPVEVCPRGAYGAELRLTDYLIYLKQGAAFDAANYLYSYTRSGQTVQLLGGLPEGLTLELSGSVDTQVCGVYAVSYTVTREQNSAAHSRLIVIVEG